MDDCKGSRPGESERVPGAWASEAQAVMPDLNRGDDGATRLRRGALAEKDVGIVPDDHGCQGKEGGLGTEGYFRPVCRPLSHSPYSMAAGGGRAHATSRSLDMQCAATGRGRDGSSASRVYTCSGRGSLCTGPRPLEGSRRAWKLLIPRGPAAAPLFRGLHRISPGAWGELEGAQGVRLEFRG